jgi:hypothetical protein
MFKPQCWLSSSTTLKFPCTFISDTSFSKLVVHQIILTEYSSVYLSNKEEPTLHTQQHTLHHLYIHSHHTQANIIAAPLRASASPVAIIDLSVQTDVSRTILFCEFGLPPQVLTSCVMGRGETHLFDSTSTAKSFGLPHTQLGVMSYQKHNKSTTLFSPTP